MKRQRSSSRVKDIHERDEKRAKSEVEGIPANLAWSEVGTLLVLDSDELPGGAKIASFDMDGAIIQTKSGRAFATNRNDWLWLFDQVPERLKKLHADGYKIIIFTNQMGIEKGKTKAGDIKGKIIDLCRDLGIPMQAFVATHDDIYRKPSTNMWTFMEQKFNKGVAINKAESFFIGDAAGRAAGWKAGMKKDHSCSDRKFASNIGIGFHTPEEFFLSESPAAFEWESIDPKTIAKSGIKAFDESKPLVRTDGVQELVVFVGLPAAGKSTFARRHFVPAGYVHINQDTLKTKAKCVKVAREAIAEGKSVVIDNTNSSKSTRGEYLELLSEAPKGKPVARCFWFQTPLDVAQHLNQFREKVTEGSQPHVPRVAYATFKKNFEEPTTSEGFEEVKKINFVPEFTDPTVEKLFYEYT